MKADERHKLKSNELVESIKELPEFIHEYGSRILTVAIIVLVVGVGLWQWLSYRDSQQIETIENLQNIMMQQSRMQSAAAQRGMVAGGQKNDLMAMESYNVSGLAGALGELASENTNTAIGMMALLQQGEAIRSTLYYSDHDMSGEEKEQLYKQAEQIYQNLIRLYPQEAVAMGTGRLGLGLLAEERGNWDQAKKTYESIVKEQDNRFAGTIFAQQARIRLALIDDIKEPIEFSMVALKASLPLVETIDEGAGVVETGEKEAELKK